MRVAWYALHEGRQEQGIKADKTAGFSELLKSRFRLLALERPSIRLRAEGGRGRNRVKGVVPPALEAGTRFRESEQLDGVSLSRFAELNREARRIATGCNSRWSDIEKPCRPPG